MYWPHAEWVLAQLFKQLQMFQAGSDDSFVSIMAWNSQFESQMDRMFAIGVCAYRVLQTVQSHGVYIAVSLWYCALQRTLEVIR